METRSARIGMVLFGVYLLLYGGFVLINAFSPSTMELTPISGVNLAIIYGFVLIIAAFLLALLYGWICREGSNSDVVDGNSSDSQEGGK